MVNPFHSTLHSRRQQAARRYSNFDKSDPFAYNRAMSHITNGIVDFTLISSASALLTPSPKQTVEVVLSNKQDASIICYISIKEAITITPRAL